jgi:hypothetical protein
MCRITGNLSTGTHMCGLRVTQAVPSKGNRDKVLSSKTTIAQLSRRVGFVLDGLDSSKLPVYVRF